MKKLFVLFAGMSLSAASFAQSAWTLDKAHSSVNFSITHMVVSEVDGSFKDFSADVKSDKPDFSDLQVAFTIEAKSVNTKDEKRDGHLKSADFFDAEKFATITFKSTEFKKEKGNNYKVKGNLTMHGVTKPVTLDAKLVGTATNPMSKKEMAGFKITGTINRADFGIGASMPDAMLSNKVTLNANTEFAKD